MGKELGASGVDGAGFVQEQERDADDQRACQRAYEDGELLFAGRCADKVAGFEVLRRSTPVGSGETNRPAGMRVGVAAGAAE